MSGHAQLAQTGAPVLVIGGISYPIGGWMLATAAGLLCLGLLCIRFGFRRKLAAGEAASTTAARHAK
ncbi:hypothetical protein [Streptomyces sp. NBC_01361]|uniref:hypothetical protein n=1 Tax=Streptomyces sp. NBC_01361 TaxID=2903838 RepID=UPI002E32ECFF|nr:hypothetical protein [Streptomyces sp. NBC_01361]